MTLASSSNVNVDSDVGIERDKLLNLETSGDDEAWFPPVGLNFDVGGGEGDGERERDVA